jgi:hypothetical protein
LAPFSSKRKKNLTIETQVLKQLATQGQISSRIEVIEMGFINLTLGDYM